MKLEEVKRFIQKTKVEGWFSEKEGQLLYNLAKKCTGKGVIVEIGSWKGKSTIYLANGSKEGNNVEIYSIDPHLGPEGNIDEELKTFKDFERNIKNAKVNDLVIPIVKMSHEAANNFEKAVEVIFVDGDHSYKGARQDFLDWFPKVVDGGIMAFHDTTSWEGPKKVVFDYLYKSKHFKNISLVGTITFATKVKRNSVKDRIENRFSLAKRQLRWFVGKLLPKKAKKKIKKFLGIN